MSSLYVPLGGPSCTVHTTDLKFLLFILWDFCDLARQECDQMGRSFFNIWPFKIMKLCPMAIFSPNRFKILPHTKLNFWHIETVWFNFFCQNVEISPNLVTLVTQDSNTTSFRSKLIFYYFPARRTKKCSLLRTKRTGSSSLERLKISQRATYDVFPN